RRVRNRSMTVGYFFDLLREALLARNYLNSYAYTFETTMPQQKWADWLKVKDRVVVEAAAIRAEDFTSDVADPTDEELQAFFDEHKGRVPTPENVVGVALPSPTPGFARPRRVVLQYAKAELSTLTDELLPTVTDEEVAAYYEENKSQFIRMPDGLGGDLLGGGMLSEEADLGPDAPADAADAGEPSAEGDAPTGEPSNSDDAAGGEPAEEEAAEETADANPASAGIEASEGAADTPLGESDASPPQQPTEGQSGASPKPSPFRYVALQVDPAVEPADGQSLADAILGPADPPTEEQDTRDAGGNAMPAGDEASQSGDAGADTQADAAAEPPIEYEPLEDVADGIRRTIAEGKAFEQQRDRMAELIAPLRLAYDKYVVAQIDALGPDGKPTVVVEPPAALTDITAFAEAAGLEFAQTADLTLQELSQSEIGGTQSLTKGDPNRPRSSLLTALVASGELVKPNEPFVTYDAFSNGYIVVVVSDTPRSEPELADVREEVVRAWKLDKAAELALKRAQEIAEQAQPEGLSLRDFLAGEPGVSVAETDPFAWYTELPAAPFARRVQIRLSEPVPLEAVGPAFMEEVFSLAPGKFGAALNHDRSVAYVVRVAQRQATRSELRQQFLETSFLSQQYGFDEVYRRRVNAALAIDLVGEDGLTWAPRDDDEG
ncbi:MAG: hypothetical protein AAF790_12405, partial [Planctomycetota bacterium]